VNVGGSLSGNPAESSILPSGPGILAHAGCNTPAHGHENRSAGSLFAFAACHKTVASTPPPTVEVAEVLQSDIQIHRQWVATLEDS